MGIVPNQLRKTIFDEFLANWYTGHSNMLQNQIYIFTWSNIFEHSCVGCTHHIEVSDVIVKQFKLELFQLGEFSDAAISL